MNHLCSAADVISDTILEELLTLKGAFKVWKQHLKAHYIQYIYDPTTRTWSNYAQPVNSVIARFDGLPYSHASNFGIYVSQPHANGKMLCPGSQMMEKMPFTATIL